MDSWIFIVFKYKATGGHKHRQYHTEGCSDKKHLKRKGTFKVLPALVYCQGNANFTTM